MRKVIVAALIFFQLAALWAQTGEITGRITDEKGEGVPFANVAAEQQGKLITGATTDFDGYYTIKPLAPGKYDIRVSYIGYATSLTQGVVVSGDKITELDVSIKPEEKVLGVVEVIEYKVPLIDKENNSTKSTISKEEIQKLPTKDINSIASLSAGVYQADEGSSLNIKGARSDGTEVYIDGIRVRGSSKLPAQGIEELTVITGGMPAKYGDATGGVVTITTRGPSRQFNGGVEVATSQGMDAYGYTLGSLELTGPVIKIGKGTDKERTLLGFYVAGEYLRQEDASPSALGVYVAKKDRLKYFEENPLVPSPADPSKFIVTTETATAEDIEKVKTKPNVVENNYSASGKLDFSLTDNINLTFGGSYDYVRRHDWVDRYTMFNYINNPMVQENTWRVYGRFLQRFGQRSGGQDGEERKSAFQNAYYSLQFDFTRVYNQYMDDDHGDRLFDYGYIGKFDITRVPTYAFGRDSLTGLQGHLQTGDSSALVVFTPADVNPTGTAFTSRLYQLAEGSFVNGQWIAPSITNLDQIILNNALRNGDRPRVPHGIWFNTGRQYNGYGINNPGNSEPGDQQQYRISLQASVDILKPGSAARSKHALEFGFEFEQLILRGYSIGSIGLWELMRQLANKHIVGLDRSNPKLLIDGEIYAWDDPNRPVFSENDTILYDRPYSASQQSTFDRNLRKKLFGDPTNRSWVNIDALPPDFFSLDMFSADELLNNGNSYVSYFGYDYKGNRLTSEPSFEDFFKQKDAEGNYTRPIGSHRPIYMAAYIQDKFNFKDILFNIGVRIDRFDANQKVLRDPYTLYRAYTVGEARGKLDPSVSIPANIGDDFVVYVDNPSKLNPTPTGYRNGDTWYTAEGVETTNPKLLFAPGQSRVIPYLVDPNIKIGDENYDPNESFKDYEPQITIMPRIAFSFNLTDEASFFAHFDILSQRPPTGLRTSPTDWLFLESNIGGFVNNPNLKAEQTIDYQLGFRQLVTSNSAITLSAFYRNLKDMVQVTAIPYFYPVAYNTFGNFDVGNVKGFSVAYDLRKTRTSNIALRLNYTIQWAEGTGSSATSQRNIVSANQPNLRTVFPLDYDSRHNIAASIDYGYGEGKDYNGPRIRNVDIFSNAFINLTVRARSGEPYTAQENPTPEAVTGVATRRILSGDINGSRLPWNFRIDLRVQKDFKLNFRNTDEGKTRRNLYLQVYLIIQNLLNTKNVIKVYPYTGNPNDDGYLASELGQQDIANQVNAQSYIDMYRAFVSTGFDPTGARNSNYSLPRQIRLGAIFKF
ncbi:MAG: hypothetical protein KatS3mg031_1545 [Chitinophagales bacterium]|nr:MAG: hypothetical protein KatS3mg031_1545 [Chitinophagales bacterium]